MGGDDILHHSDCAFTPLQVRPLATVTLMYVAWALGEGIRFLWALARVFELSTRPLTWLRYSSFFVLFPLGFGTEMKIIWAALPHLAAHPDLRLALGPVVITYHAVMQVRLCGRWRPNWNHHPTCSWHAGHRSPHLYAIRD